MKSIFKIVLLLSYIWVAGATSSLAQEKTSYIPEGKYLVIGTFRIKKNAIGFTNYVKSLNKYEVSMAYHPLKDYYYVYIKGYGPGEDGTADVNKMRRQTEFTDSWYMVVTPYEIPGTSNTTIAASGEGKVQEVSKPVTNTSEKNQQEEKHTPEPTDEGGDSPSRETDSGGGWVKASKASDPATGNPASADLGRIVPKTYNEEGKYKMYFNTYYVKNFKEVKGPVEIINPKTLKILKVAQSQELVRVPDPNNREHAIQLIANIFGYKKVQHDLKLNEPLDSINIEFFHFKGDTLVADFPLRRYEVGEIATMYNVYFFKDAVIMKPISKFELNTLVDMLKENDNLKIRIHGHTNGNAAGRILLMPEGSEDYFSLNQNIVEDRGSAKELSIQRAEVIKKYLMSYGISADRMEIKGWGGKKPLYDKLDKLAIKNVRVEIEILEN